MHSSVFSIHFKDLQCSSYSVFVDVRYEKHGGNHSVVLMNKLIILGSIGHDPALQEVAQIFTMLMDTIMDIALDLGLLVAELMHLPHLHHLIKFKTGKVQNST